MKKLLFGLFIFVCLAIVGLLALPSFIDWNTRRDWVERQLSALLDRQVAIEGALDFALLPTPILSAESVRLSDGLGGTLADIAVVDLRMALLPLVGGRFDLEQVTLIDPVVELGEGDGALSVGTAFDDPSTAGRIRVDRMTIENGSVRWHDPETAGQVTFDQIFAQISADSLAGPFSIVGGLRVGGQPVSLELNAGRLSSAGAWPMTIAFGLDGSGLEGRYSGLVRTDGRLQGDLRLDGDDLAQAVGTLVGDVDLPSEWAQPFSLSAQLVGRDGVADLSALEFGVAETRASGAMSIALGAEPTIALDLNVNRVDLASRASARPIAWSALLAGDRSSLPDGLRLTMNVSVGALGLGGTPVRQVRLNATLGEGALSVSRFTAQLPGGTDLRAVGTLGPGEDGSDQADVALELASGDLRRLLTWAGIDVTAVPGTRLRAFNGRASIVGTPDNLQIAGLDMVVDAMRVSGGLAYRNRGRPGLGLRLEVDDLNLDAYSNEPLGSPREVLAGSAAELISSWSALADFDANVDIDLGRLTVAGIALDGVRLAGTINRGVLDLREASFADLEGATAYLYGRIDQVWPFDGFDLTLDLAAEEPQRLLDLFVVDPGWPVERLGGGQASIRAVGGFDRVDLQADLTLANGEVALGGSVADPLGQPVYDLAARIIHDDLLQAIHLAAPSYAPRGDLGALDLYATIEGTRDALVLDNLIGQFGDITVGGMIELGLAGQRPSFDAALGVNNVSIEPFLPRPEASFVAPGDSRWSTQPFDWPDLGGIDGHALLTASAIQVAGLALDAPAFEGSLRQGVLEISQASAGLFGGQAGLSGRLDFAEPTDLSFDIALANADLAQLLDDALQIDGASGTVDFALTGSGVGRDPASLIADLRGDGLLAVRDGSVDRLDLTAVSDRLATLEGPLEFLEVVRGPLIEGTTAFAAFNAPLTLNGGALSSDAIRWRADAGLGEGSAMLDLDSLIFDALLDVTLFAHPEAPSFAIGFSGPLDRLERALDTDALRAWVEQRAAEALTDRLRQPTEEQAEEPDGATDGPATPESGQRPLVPDAGGLSPSDNLRSHNGAPGPASGRLPVVAARNDDA